ncbi:hydantoinase/oxoprolinase family protein [Zongyangia hominis]|uniref:Hydantoinase/oxoprolinase family protein n=1 Tax=Zongyangia hominis TaxID=2763677 RepID=A0A926I754_9FIRM|nr:hydantoinase/oxoprolinase family protein [Zongyangia hominis]MBC8570719.1 hydantoinase/oxoprolinase family protein [Zongyangia hominis]
MSYRLSADIGGTFTDVVCINDATGEYTTTKVLTTPEKLTNGIMKGFDEVIEDRYKQVQNIVHGTTSGLNAVIERKGAKCAVITTRGFGDVLEIGRGNRPDMYNNRYQRPRPLVPRKDIYEVDERTSADGSVKLPLQTASLEAIAGKLKDGGYESIAICLINSYLNPENEEKAAAWLKDYLGEGVMVITSSETAREWREYERTSTTVLNAYVSPITKSHLVALNTELKTRDFEGNLYIMQSNGGVMKDEIAVDKAVQILMSGPVGGAIGGTVCGRKNVIGVDMGGTSFDVSLIVDGQTEITVESNVEGFPALVPTVNIFSIGAGGGSIAWEEGGGMRVGPQSAGAKPGPACYGQGGTQPTITDANLVLGRIDPDHFLDGRMKLDIDAAKKAVSNFADKFGMDIPTAAEGILAIANHKMADAIREITVRRGIDPREFTLLAFGGAGPMHAAHIAEELGIEEVMIPAVPGGFSAWGMLQADIRHDAVRTQMAPIDEVDSATIDGIFDVLYEELCGVLAKEGISPDNAVFHKAMDLRYVGQEFTINLPVDDASAGAFDKEVAKKNFHSLHERLYGHSAPGDPVEMVNVRLSVMAASNKVPASPVEGVSGEPKAIREFPGVFDFKEQPVKVYNRSDIGMDSKVKGPAVIVELTATTVVPPAWTLTVNEMGSMVMVKE